MTGTPEAGTKTMPTKSIFLKGKMIVPRPIKKNIGIVDLVDNYFQAHNAARLREACQLFTQKVLEEDVTVEDGNSSGSTEERILQGSQQTKIFNKINPYSLTMEVCYEPIQ
ncbi:MAG: hypothetical protein NTV54_08155 [Ignavibacteriales bacterium]|nr:hypothetical protein [Ignavibacteriales bacterium]